MALYKLMVELYTLQKLVIECGDDPYNVGVPANAIMNAVNWLKTRLPEGTPVIVLLGESHKYFMHPILTHAVLAQMAKNGMKDLAFGLEQPAAFSDRDASMPNYISDYRGFYTVDLDIQGQGMTLHSSASLYSAVATIDFCEKTGIPVSFNDAASFHENGQFGLDLEHVDAKAVLAKHKDFDPSALKRPDLTSSIGFRNHVIVKRALDHIKETQAQVYVQQTGFDHLFGADYSEDMPKPHTPFMTPYSQSLSQLFREKGCAVLTVYHSDIATAVPPEGRQSYDQSMVVDGLSYEISLFKQRSQKQDKALWDRINKDSGGLLSPNMPA